MSKPKSIKIDDVTYVPEDSIPQGPDELDSGKTYCIVRSRNAGVVCGYVDYDNTNSTTVEVHQGRQMWRWDSAFVLLDMAESGVRKESDCKFSEPQRKQKVFNACQLIECSANAAESLKAVKNANR